MTRLPAQVKCVASVIYQEKERDTSEGIFMRRAENLEFHIQHTKHHHLSLPSPPHSHCETRGGAIVVLVALVAVPVRNFADCLKFPFTTPSVH
ncbi:hypothetical protein H5410_022465 [Solanum commersonii]|uniref:Uncharacterized protein n=1 Tax=Solanum commersonii TaxID=4109 RepID=A0A9J5ZH91_SOLCO|nr:hypothetical protein H5410_022465 [Solanum commersonii]